MNKLIPVFIIVAVVVSGGAFYGGMKYAENKSSQGQFSRVNREVFGDRIKNNNFRGGVKNGNDGGFIVGEIRPLSKLIL